MESEKVTVKWNGDNRIAQMPGFTGRLSHGDQIIVSKDLYEAELKQNHLWELVSIKKESKKENKIKEKENA